MFKNAFFSSLVNLQVVDSQDKKIGRFCDFTISVGSAFPVIESAIVIHRGTKVRLYWDQIKEVTQDVILLNIPMHKVNLYEPREGEILLKEDLLDKQIVDTHGYKVVRVNDLQINKVDHSYILAGVDVGTQGILRRLGLEKSFGFLLKLFKRSPPENIIPWDYVAPLNIKDLNYIKLVLPHKKLVKIHPADLAEILTDLHGKERRHLFSSLDKEVAADALQEMEDEDQVSLINSLPDEHASDILEEMDPDDAADLLTELPKDRAEELLGLMEHDEAKEVKELLSYPEESAGGIMTTEYISLSENMTAEEVIEKLRELAPSAEMIYYLYIVDNLNHLRGVLSLRNLIVAGPKTPIKDIMFTKLYKVNVSSGVKEVAELTDKYGLLAMPVVDNAGRLKGIITVDDVVDMVRK